MDALLEAHGHSVLRLPPYSPHFNPIEMIWAIVKGRVASLNTTYNLDDVQRIANEQFALVTVQEWQECCKHVVEIERKAMEKEHLLDDMYDSMRFVVNTGESDFSSESSDSDSSLSGVETLPD